MLFILARTSSGTLCKELEASGDEILLDSLQRHEVPRTEWAPASAIKNKHRRFLSHSLAQIEILAFVCVECNLGVLPEN